MTDAPSPPPAAAAQQSFWDPVGPTVTPATFRQAIEKLDKKLQSLREHPRRMLWIMRGLWIFGIVATLLLLAAPLVFDTQHWNVDGRIIIFFFAPALGYRAYIKKLQTDMVCHLFADQHGWVYNPDDSHVHWSALASAFPQIFRKGTGGQAVTDEFWGNVQIEGSSYAFWQAVFQFTVRQGKSSTTYHQEAIAFRLPRKIAATLVLTPEHFSFFGKDDLKVESSDFNKTFNISCPGMDGAKQQEVVRALSPAVQTGLLDLRKGRGAFSLWLQNEAIVFCFVKARPAATHTNFFKSVSIDPRDEDELNAHVKQLLTITGELLKYLD